MDRFKKVKLASIFGIFGNIFLLIIKGIIGFISNSQAMIADAINSAGDILSSFITFIGNIIASKPSDEDHNLGHGKAEYIYSMLISLVMIVMGVLVLKDSILSIIFKNKYEFSIWIVIVCLITILVKFVYIYIQIIFQKNIIIYL